MCWGSAQCVCGSWTVFPLAPCDAPPCSSAPHELIHRAFVDAQVRHPAEMLDLVSVPLPALQKIDAQVSIGLIERHIPYEPKPVAQPCLGILPVVREHPSSSFGCGYVLKHVGMVAFFHSQD